MFIPDEGKPPGEAGPPGGVVISGEGEGAALIWLSFYVTKAQRVEIDVDFQGQGKKTFEVSNGVIQILAAILCPLVTCSNVSAISFHSIFINLQ